MGCPFVAIRYTSPYICCILSDFGKDVLRLVRFCAPRERARSSHSKVYKRVKISKCESFGRWMFGVLRETNKYGMFATERQREIEHTQKKNYRKLYIGNLAFFFGLLLCRSFRAIRYSRKL